MNLEVWKRELRGANILEENRDILKGLKDGLHQGIPEEQVGNLRYYCPPNHSSALEARKEIEENFEKELEGGRMYGPFSKEEVYTKLGFFRTSPLGAVINGDGTLRPINDLSFPKNNSKIRSVNAKVDKGEFTTSWDDFEEVAVFLLEAKGPVLLGIYNWAHAYRQIPTLMSQWPFLMLLDFEGGILLDTRVTFGGVAGCGTFGQVADAWKQVMQSKFGFLRAFRWVDNTLFVKKADGSNNTKMTDVVKLSEEMGVVSNTKKWKEFAYEQKYLGMIWNGRDKTVRLPQDKIKKRLCQIRKFRSEGGVNYKAAEKMVGRLYHLTSIYPQLRCHCMALYHWMAEWKNRLAKRDIPEEILEDLERWTRTLTLAESRRLIPRKGVVNIGWVGDASTSYGIGVIVGKKWARFRLRSGWNDRLEDGSRREIASAETVAVRLGLIMVVDLMETNGRDFLVLTDNVVTEGAIRNGKSRNQWVNREWIRIQDELLRLNCCITQRRVVSGDNAADRLSRGLDCSKHVEDMIHVRVPRDLQNLISQE